MYVPVIIQRIQIFVYRLTVTILSWYNKGKKKPDVICVFLEKIIFWARLGEVPNFKNPNNLWEFVCSQKLYGDFARLAAVADKIAVRKYVEQRIGSSYLKKLIDVVDNENDITEERYLRYPEQFVAKPNHASERIFIHKEYDYSLFRNGIRNFLDEFGNCNNEFHYKYIDKKLIIEEYLNSSDKPLKEFKVWVFHGKAEFIDPSLSILESKLRNDYRYRWYDRNWEEPRVQVRDNLAPYVEPPKQLAEIIKISEELASGWDFIRVDIYLSGDTIKFGELTPTPSAGRSPFISLDDHRYLYNTYLRKATHSN